MIPGRIRRFCQGLRREVGSITLDILTAIAITLTLVAIVAPSVISQVRNARANALIGDIETIRNNLIKFFSDTQQMPIILDTALIIANRSGAEKINGVKGLTSGLFVNDKPITLWQGSYIEKEIAFNPFMGTYFLDYSTKVTTSQGELATSAVLVVTQVPNGQVEFIDETIDDGDPSSGIIQIASRIGVGGFSNQMVVVILEDIVIDPVTGLPDYELSGTSFD